MTAMAEARKARAAEVRRLELAQKTQEERANPTSHCPRCVCWPHPNSNHARYLADLPDMKPLLGSVVCVSAMIAGIFVAVWFASILF